MGSRFLAKLKENLGLKLLSVLIAVVIWYVVVDVNDPVETESYSVKITVENDSYISNGKQVYHIDDSYKTVTVYLKGNRSVLKNISAEDITVTADLTQIVDMDTDPVMVPLSASCPGISASNITLSRQAIPITIETVDSREFPVTVDVGDSEPGTNYEVGTTTPNPEKVVITGAASIVDSIDTVVAKIDVTGMTQNGTKAATLVISDTSGKQLSEETIADDLTFDGGVPDVTVYVELWKKVSGVTLDVQYSGTPAKGYNVNSVSTTPQTVTLVGDDEAVAELGAEGNKLTIPADMISVSGASSDVTAEINLADILPDNMRVAENTSGTVSVTIQVLSDGSREFSIDVDNIEVDDLSDSLSISYDQTTVAVIVTGTKSVVDAMTASDIKVSIDARNLEEGDMDVTLNVSLPTGVSLSEPVNMKVHVKAKATPTATETPSSAAG
ncbi:CdaR family protein [Bilifractor porci]|uniref:YbbR-like protein n=1 Tax=Bilifractor porci TaxID=2606636 RepID=A0A7X2TPX4_9FIRM|nr:CdaR family protein [Bilifractor porci]MST82241.1 hypothetical protein [Bilifractor porci]